MTNENQEKRFRFSYFVTKTTLIAHPMKNGKTHWNAISIKSDSVNHIDTMLSV